MSKKTDVFDKRVDIIMLVTCHNSLLQMDPDTGARRIDPETGHGLVTPQGFTNKVRRLMQIEGKPLFLTPGGGPPLEQLIREGVATAGLGGKASDSEDDEEDEPKAKGKAQKATSAQRFTIADRAHLHKEFCKLYTDVRFFGASLTKPVNQPIPGAVQFSLARSEFPLPLFDGAITRGQVTSMNDKGEKTMGRMPSVFFEMTKVIVSINPFRCLANGFTYEDYEWLLQALPRMFEATRSAVRFNVCVERLYIAEHESQYGNLQMTKFSRRVTCLPKNDMPRELSDVEVEFNQSPVKGVKFSVIECP